MRHGKKVNHLSRKTAHRKQLLSNLACSLVEHKRIKTTIAKAKALRIYVEPLINRSKENSMHNRRMVFKKLQSKKAVNVLFNEISSKIGDRPGGYTRIIKVGTRLGDNAEMAFIELVDYNEVLLEAAASKASGRKGKTRRTRRKKKSGGDAGAAEATAATAVAAKATDEVKDVVDDVTDAANDAAEGAQDAAQDAADQVTE